jgi:uncharacterized protein
MTTITASAHPANENGQAVLASENELRPVRPTDRISSLDVLRGVALLGILLMNIIGFGLPFAYDNPSNAGGATGANLGFWFVNHVLFEGKMRALFSLLFGAGAVLLLSRGEKKSGTISVADIYYRRLLWLLMFGLLNAYVLLWYGDILYPYALLGLFLFPLRNLSPRVLIAGALLMFGVMAFKAELKQQEFKEKQTAAALADTAAASGKELTEEQKADQTAYTTLLENEKPKPEKIEKRIKSMQAGYGEVFKTLLPINQRIQSVMFYNYFWDMLGMMLLGMGLIKIGVFTPSRSSRFYGLMALVGFGIGIPLGIYNGLSLIEQNWSAEAMLGNNYTYDLRRLGVVLGHVGLIMLVYKSGIVPWLMAALAAVGRMAFTNYLMQSIICTLVFYGYGLGLYGKLERVELLYVVGAVWAFQLVASPLWLRYFHFGPLEWAWRSLTYWSPQPLRKVPAPARQEEVAAMA